jgi:murein L,D-transpeptidase YafK
MLACVASGCAPTEPYQAAAPAPGNDAHAAAAKAQGPYLYLRAFKHERELEAYVASELGGPYELAGKWRVAGMSGTLGPKRREGDRQVPEGLYVVDRFNPRSRYHLSLGLDYPNASDRARGDRRAPGSDIFIHGSNVSIGCLAMTDPVIEVVYRLATEARDAGQRWIRADIFPFRMDAETMDAMGLRHPEHAPLWRELEPFYSGFDQRRAPVAFVVARDGAYRVQPEG